MHCKTGTYVQKKKTDSTLIRSLSREKQIEKKKQKIVDYNKTITKGEKKNKTPTTNKQCNSYVASSTSHCYVVLQYLAYVVILQ